MTKREVTEADFRKPELRDAKVEDYEFDGTGEVVRKDRWETAVRRIVGMLEDSDLVVAKTFSRRSFKIDSVTDVVQDLIDHTTLTSRP